MRGRHVNSDSHEQLRQLYESLDRRLRPEDVANMIGDVLVNDLSTSDARTLDLAAQKSVTGQFGWFSSMSSDFSRPVGMERQCRVAAQLFTETIPLEPQHHADPTAIRKYLNALEEEIVKDYGRNDFQRDRRNRQARKAAGLDLSKRQYNKRFRLAARMERKQQKLVRELKKRNFTLISKSRLASTLSWDEFSREVNSACFVAYYTARCNLRSEFTVGKQQRPYDNVAAMLLERCRRSDRADWWSIVHVYPEQEVLSHLSDEQKGKLLARWYSILIALAEFLRELWETNSFDAQTMIVRRGNDSTTWNNTAGAWNHARDGWFSLLFAMNMEDVVEQMCPGKVLRLMAADVAAWHRSTGGTLENDTFVWQLLPFPWEVISGERLCSRADVENACYQQGLDPIKKGWSAPRPKGKVHPFRPTPELLHGVTVNSPELALVLRKLG